MVEWIENASLVCLNHLFAIDVVERKYTMLLTKKNFKGVLSHPTLFVLQIIPRITQDYLVLGEHFFSLRTWSFTKLLEW